MTYKKILHSLPWAVKSLGALGILLSCSAASLTAEDSVPVVEIRKTVTPPTIDGIFSEEEWQGASKIGPFVLNNNGAPSDNQTVAYLSYDDQALYLLFWCDEPDMKNLKSDKMDRHDGPVWNNDSVEILLRPDTASSDFMHFILDSEGQKYDALGSDSFGYNPTYQVGVNRYEDHWILEVAIPFSSLSGTAPGPGSEWQGDFFLTRHTEPSQNAWSATGGQYGGSFKKFGFLVFDSVKTALTNMAEQRAQASTEFQGKIPENINGILDAFDQVLAKIQSMDETVILEEYASLRKEITDLREDYQQAAFTAKWSSAGLPVAIQPAETFSDHSMERSAADAPTELTATFLKGETREFAWNLTNISDTEQVLQANFRYAEPDDYFRQGLPGFKIEHFTAYPIATIDGTQVYDLMAKNSSGTIRIAPGSTVQMVMSVEATENAPAETKGHLLFRPVNGAKWAPFDLPVTFTVIDQQLITPEVPFMTFAFDRVIFPLFAERPDFVEEHYNALVKYGFNTTQLCGLTQCPRPKTDADGNFTEELDFSQLDTILDKTAGKFDQYYLHLAIFEKLTFRTDLFGIPFDSPGYEKAFKAWLKAIMDRIEAHGIDKKQVFINVYDESTSDAAYTMEKWVKEIDPEYVTLLDTLVQDMDVVRKFNQYNDVWMPHARTLNEPVMKEFHQYAAEQGRAMMTYYYSTGSAEKTKPPFSEYIAKFWICYDRNLTGLAYWAGGQYYGDAFYRANSPGYDTSLFYPTENDVHPSRRAMAWRRGLADYHLLKLAEHKLQEQNQVEALNSLRDDVRSVIANTNDLEAVEQVREKCRQIIAGN